MKNAIPCTLAIAVCVALLGCAGEERRFTGFLGDYSILKPHPAVDGGLVYWNRVADPEHLRAVLVEPVEIQFADPSEEQRTKPEEVASFRTSVNDDLIAALSKHLVIATEPGPDVLRCRLQVANLRLTRSLDEPPHPWPSRDYSLGTANIEADARDLMSGELATAFVGPRGSVQWRRIFFLESSPDRWEEAKTAVRSQIIAWADQTLQRVTEPTKDAAGVPASHPIQWSAAHHQGSPK